MANQTLVQVKEIEQEAKAIRSEFEQAIADKKAEMEAHIDQLRQHGKQAIENKVQEYAQTLDTQRLAAESQLQATIQQYEQKSAQALQENRDRLVDDIIHRVKERFLTTTN